MNGILLEADLFGKSYLYGTGAGGKETSSAILADLIDLSFIYKKEKLDFRYFRNNTYVKINENIVWNNYYIRINFKKIEEDFNLFIQENDINIIEKKYLKDVYEYVLLVNDIQLNKFKSFNEANKCFNISITYPIL